MASAQIGSLIRMYRKQPAGNMTLVAQQRIEQLAPAGGASEGTLSSVATPEKLITLNSGVVFQNDDVLLITAATDANATIGTVTKSIWSVPIVTPTGSSTLGRAQFATPALTANALVAGFETVLAGYKVTEGALRVAGKVFLDLQNNS